MPEWVLQLIGYGGAMVTVYAGIRADLAALKVKAEMAMEAADSAHRRIDTLHTRGVP